MFVICPLKIFIFLKTGSQVAQDDLQFAAKDNLELLLLLLLPHP